MSLKKNISNALASIGNNKTKNHLDAESIEENNTEELEGEKIGAKTIIFTVPIIKSFLL